MFEDKAALHSSLSASTTDGGSAFPIIAAERIGNQPIDLVHQRGMSLRDYFAAKTMQGIVTGLMSNVDTLEGFAKTAKKQGMKSEVYIAFSAYEQADAMLAEREKK